jgi:hypothetical protein
MHSSIVLVTVPAASREAMPARLLAAGRKKIMTSYRVWPTCKECAADLVVTTKTGSQVAEAVAVCPKSTAGSAKWGSDF